MSEPAASGLVLASGSRYRAQLLERLGVDFQARPPDVDESARPGETPESLAIRLARLKAATLQAAFPTSWIIGSDQVASCGSRTLGKPGTMEAATRQLRASSGRTVDFHTAVCVLGPDDFEGDHCDLTRVHFRALDDHEIARYLAREPALDCAGSFRIEGLGASLFTAVETRDPTALVGLPLIALSRLLRDAGFALP